MAESAYEQLNKTSFLDEVIRLLVENFGAKDVHDALVRATIAPAVQWQKPSRESEDRAGQSKHPTIATALELIRENEPEKYQVLSEFFKELKDRKILPESQDIRYFAQLIGLKTITGKSRKDMIPKLMRFLPNEPSERLLNDVKKADGISEQQRQQGFSVLTDELLGSK